jgi:hypothetical protein
MDGVGAGAGPLNEDVNVQGIVLALWRGFYRWWLGAFIGLSIIRLLIVIVMHRRATQIQDTTGVSSS